MCSFYLCQFLSPGTLLYHLIDPTNRSHTIVMVSAVTVSSDWTSHYISNWLKSKLPLSHRVPSCADSMRFENRSSKHWTTVCAQLSRFRTSSLVVCMTCGAVWCSVLQCGATWCSVLQCVAVCCSVLQCVAVDCPSRFQNFSLSVPRCWDFVLSCRS